MANDATQVSVAVSGAISKVSDALAITSANSSLTDPGTINYGFVTSDGVSITADRTTNNITAWQNSSVVRVTGSESSATYTFTLLQNTKEVRELYFGNTENANGKIQWKPGKIVKGRFVIDYVDSEWGGLGDVLYGRHDIKKGNIIDIGQITLANGEPIGYEVTITALPDADGIVAEVYHGTAVLS